MLRRHGEVLTTPFPYRAILAISSDLDDTPSWKHYFELITFLNSRQMTIFGPGVGLEFANSIFFKESSSPVAYNHAGTGVQANVRNLIRTGHIDTLHSFGADEALRSGARDSLETLAAHRCQLPVWTDHWVSPTNFDPFKPTAQGAKKSYPAYCADLVAKHGVSYVWAGRLTTVVGQGRRLPATGALAGRCNSLQGFHSAAMETAKHALGRLGMKKFAMRASNKLVQPLAIGDGLEFIEFLRAYPSPLPLHVGDSADGVAAALATGTLLSLIRSRGAMILYTHLGRRMPLFGEPGSDLIHSSLNALRDLEDRGLLKTLSTARLLDFVAVRDRTDVAISGHPNALRIEIEPDPKDRVCIAALARSGAKGLGVVVPRTNLATFHVMGRNSQKASLFHPSGSDYSIAYLPIGSLPEPAL